jgi:hypothetical protein
VAEGKAQISAPYGMRSFILTLTSLCIAGLVTWFGYVHIFTKGLERLPERICENSVRRDLVVQILPRTRTADEGSGRRNGGKELSFSCRVYTSAGPILSGSARIDDASVETWLDHYGGSTDRDAVRVAANDIEALARLDRESGNSYIYVPCVPNGIRAGDANEFYAIVSEASVIGNSRVSGVALRQAVTDFAYELAKHTYKLAECQGHRNIVGKLPRYEDQ